VSRSIPLQCVFNARCKLTTKGLVHLFHDSSIPSALSTDAASRSESSANC
jgi:hypothetical protein